MTDVDKRLGQELFEEDPSLFLDKAIKEYTKYSPKNHLSAFNNDPIFDKPMVGFTDGGDPIFEEYKRIIGNFHLTPREVLAIRLRDKGAEINQPTSASVASWVLPITYETRLSERRESLVPSLRWNHTRWQGGDFMSDLSSYVVNLLEELGYQAVSPNIEKLFSVVDLANGRASNWSQRHIAYAAGLGTFSLSDGFISPKGITVRCGNVVTDAVVPPSPRTYSSYLANCLFYRDGSCRRCIERCPANAISESGHDKISCREFVMHGQRELLKKLGQEQGYMGEYPACGACQTKVPCEDRIPPGIKGKR